MVVVVCQFCLKPFATQFRRASISCKRCNSVSTSYTIQHATCNKHNFFLKVIERRAANNLVDETATLIKFGYSPCSLGPFSAKKVVAICEFCGDKYDSCLNTLSKRKSASCMNCSGIASMYALSKSIANKKNFASNRAKNNADMIMKLAHLIDVNATKDKFGYDPLTLTPFTRKQIVHVCPYCKILGITSMAYFIRQSGQVTCIKCIGKKFRNTLQIKYGVSSVTSIPEVKAKLSNPITERLVKSVLDRLGVKYERQYPTGPYTFDFYVPASQLLIECQGDFWHNFKCNGYAGTPRDRGKATYVERHTAYKLVSIWEHEINLGRIFTILSRNISVTAEDMIVTKLSDMTLQPISLDQSSAFFSQYHYIGPTRSTHHQYGAITPSGKLVSACSFGPPIRQCTCSRVSTLSGVPLTNEGLRELKRFCIAPTFTSVNAASYFLSRFAKMLKTDRPSTVAITSFSDPTVGHSGGIYAATGWVKLGETSKSYHYLDPATAKSIHKKTVYGQARNLSMTEQEFVQKVGLIKVNESEKTLWMKRMV